MNASTREILLIFLSLAVVLGTGFGAGRLLTQRQVADDAPPQVPLAELETETLSALRERLELRPDQEQAIAGDLKSFSQSVFDTREQAMLEYHKALLELHDRILPKLEGEQRDVLERNRRQLRETMERRFSPPSR